MMIISSFIKLLAFKATTEDMRSYGKAHLMAGLVLTWFVGIGRYWDDPKAHLLQHLGVGSIVYVFVLSAFIFLLLLPLKVQNLKYRHLLTFITMTSLPAILYAVPIERMVSINTATTVNIYFLGIVAFWRVALLFFYFLRYLRLAVFTTIITAFLPLVLIVSALSFLNLEHAVFNIMGGLREKTSNDSAYAIVIFLTFCSWILLAPSLISYGIIMYKKRKSIS